MPEHMKQDKFELDGKVYYWVNMHSLETDENVMEKNSDVLGIVKSNF